MSSGGRKMVKRMKRFVGALERGEDVTQRFTCRTMRLNLQPQAYDPKRVKEVRGMLSASQSIFAQFLGVSTSTVRDWEQGLKSPRGIACRLMDEIRINPKYWIRRLKELTVPISTE